MFAEHFQMKKYKMNTNIYISLPSNENQLCFQSYRLFLKAINIEIY